MQQNRTFFRFATPLLLATAAAAPAQQWPDNYREVKQIIMMVPDGMGLANVTATRIRLNGVNGAPLNLETLEHVGYQRTYSEANVVTDSSAAASAFACGEKFTNNEVCYHNDGRPHNPTVLELAKMRGMATGLVATQTITHATPASFGSHFGARKCENEIARQYLFVTQPDVLLGGGVQMFNGTAGGAADCPSSSDYLSLAAGQGYTYVTTREAMQSAVAGGTAKLLGLFAGKNLTPEHQRPAETTQPRLPEMTISALSILEKSGAGFFLMVEGSLIDSGNHAENPDYQFGEMKAFDESVRVVLDWINATPDRRLHTLLIIVPDHETGGFAVIGSETPKAGLTTWWPGWTYTLKPEDPKDFEAHHTGGDIVVWSQGPGSQELARPFDNTFIYEVVKRALRM